MPTSARRRRKSSSRRSDYHQRRCPKSGGNVAVTVNIPVKRRWFTTPFFLDESTCVPEFLETSGWNVKFCQKSHETHTQSVGRNSGMENACRSSSMRRQALPLPAPTYWILSKRRRTSHLQNYVGVAVGVPPTAADFAGTIMAASGQKQTKCTAVKERRSIGPCASPKQRTRSSTTHEGQTGELWRRLSARLQFVLYQGRAGHPLRAEP